MANWKHTVKGVRDIIQSFDEDTDSSAENVRAVHAIISKRSCFAEFIWLDDMKDFENTGDQEWDMQEANALFASMYDYADSERIWLK